MVVCLKQAGHLGASPHRTMLRLLFFLSFLWLSAQGHHGGEVGVLIHDLMAILKDEGGVAGEAACQVVFLGVTPDLTNQTVKAVISGSKDEMRLCSYTHRSRKWQPLMMRTITTDPGLCSLNLTLEDFRRPGAT